MSQLAKSEIPAHIPAHLVRDWTLEEVSLSERDPFEASSNAAHRGPDIFYSPSVLASVRLGAWVTTRNEYIREVYQDAETFSSKHIAGFSLLLGENWDLIPLEKDAPDHAIYRAIMNPLFSPKRLAELEPGIRQSCIDLIEGCLRKGKCDFEVEFAHPFPVAVFLRLMGLPLDLTTKFLTWETALLQGQTMEERIDAARAIKDYLVEMIAERRRTPTDDLISFAVTSKVQGRILTDEEALGICYLLFVAGLDTVAGAIGLIFKHLAENPEQQRLLRQNPALIPNAIEEMLRAFAIVTSNRLVAKDVDFHGVKMKAGDRIVLPTQLAGRDDREYTDPNVVNFHRENVRHITFAAGPHRCIGSHLARREIKIALEEWLTRVPEFFVQPGRQAAARPTGVWGVASLPITW